MSKKDKLKEEIGFLKFIFGIVVAVILSIAGWFATNLENAKMWQFIGGGIVGFISILVVFLICNKIVIRLKQLENEE